MTLDRNQRSTPHEEEAGLTPRNALTEKSPNPATPATKSTDSLSLVATLKIYYSRLKALFLDKLQDRRFRFTLSFTIFLLFLYILIHTLRPSKHLLPVPRFHSKVTKNILVGRREKKIHRLYGIGKDGGRSWLDHILKLDGEGLAPATKFTQKYLYDHQNPLLKECAKKQFMVMNMGYLHDRSHGLGSMIHMTSFPIRNAIESNRILMWGDDDHTHVKPNLLKGAYGRIFVEDDCSVDGVRSLDCIFEPLSHCPRSSMREDNTVYGTVVDPPLEYPELGTVGHWVIPKVFKDELERILPWNMTAGAMKYWWRGQSAAYLMRLNSQSLEYISNLRLDPTSHSAFTVGEDKSIIPLNMPFPLYRGTISYHIRHGDKAKEMALHALKSYVKLGELVADQNPNSLAKMAFLSSEDPSVFEEARKIRTLSTKKGKSAGGVTNENWLWFTSHIGRINGSPFAQLDAFGNRTETTLSWMSETLLALECDAFIGTRGSNWNRVIDELRCIWIDSCKGPYLEVGDEEDWPHYSW